MNIIRQTQRPSSCLNRPLEMASSACKILKSAIDLSHSVRSNLEIGRFDMAVPSAAKLPEYLSEIDYASPSSANESAMHSALGMDHFEWMRETADRQATFDSYMQGRRKGQAHWSQKYPIERIVDGFRDDTPLLLDVAGGRGHDLIRLREFYPDLKGRLILQEQAAVLKDRLKGDFETMEYDFNLPQPVKNGRAYYFRSIFHDWPFEKCQTILLNQIGALSPEYSKILIHEYVLPDANCPPGQASLDIQMMGLNCGQERSEREWRELLTIVGLRVEGIWKDSTGAESVIEAVMPDGAVARNGNGAKSVNNKKEEEEIASDEKANSRLENGAPKSVGDHTQNMGKGSHVHKSVTNGHGARLNGD